MEKGNISRDVATHLFQLDLLHLHGLSNYVASIWYSALASVFIHLGYLERCFAVNILNL